MRIVQSAKPSRLGRHALIALVLVYAASACVAIGAERPAEVAAPAPGVSRDPGTLAALPTDALALSLATEAFATAVPGAGTSGAPSAVPSASPSGVAPSTAPATAASPSAVEGSAGQVVEKERRKPKVRTIRLKPRPKPGPFSMNLYRKGDFVHQQTKDWCVAGSTQTMMNIMDSGRPDRSAALQKRLYLKGRRLSPNKAKLGPIGVDLIGWAELLNSGGYGPYVVDGARTRKGAIKMAARAIRETGKPVGLVVWRGAHSWVMSGFTATADPAYTNKYKVTSVHIQDVWYPYVSSIWGASRPPDTRVPVAALGEDFLRYARPRARWPKRDGKFMLILPTLPRNTVVR